MNAPWWAGLGPVEAELACGDGVHRLRWEAGQLVALDHPDPEGELVLAALGGPRAACVELAQAWESHHDDLQVLVLGPRGPHDELTLTFDDLEVARASMTGGGGSLATSVLRSLGGSAQVFSTFVGAPSPGTRPATLSAIQREDEAATARHLGLLSLLTLGDAFQERLAGTVVDAWVAHMAADSEGVAGSDTRVTEGDAQSTTAAWASVEPTLVAALAGRVAPAVGAWLGIDPDQVEVSLLHGSGWGRLRTASPGLVERVTVELPLDWLSRVWAPRMAVVDGYFVVAVEQAAWPEATVLALSGPGQEPERIALRFEGQGSDFEAPHWTLCRSGGGSR